ncbi:MAG: alpha/beta fold hydrolase, partial [bacterium]
MKKQSLIIFGLIALLLWSFSYLTYAGEKSKVITPEMVVDLQFTSSVTMDPTGKNIAYIKYQARKPDDKPGGRYSELWVVSTDGTQKQFTHRPTGVSSPAWTPDGKGLTFLSRRSVQNDKTQVYFIPVDGGEARPLTDSPTSIRSYHWSPDGKWIAYTTTEPQTDEEKKQQKAGQDWKVIDKNYKHHQLWAFEVASKKTHQIVKDKKSVWSFAWSPDSKQLVVQASETPKTDDSYMFKRLYTVSAAGGDLSPLTKTEGKLGSMAWSPDGKSIAFLAGVDKSDPATGGLFVVSASGGESKNILEGYKGTPSWLNWLDKKTLVFSAVEATISTFNSIPAKGGTITKLYPGNTGFSSVSFSNDKKSFACARSTNKHPAEVYWGKLKSDKLIRLTRSNPELENIEFANQEEIRWQAKDGLEITGLLIKPLNYEQGKRSPLIVQVHGGPESAYVNGWNTSYGRWTQLLAARGYVVFMPNYRASTGRGVEYAKADHKDLAGKEFDDVLDGIDHLVDIGLVDPEKVGMGGGSYGGYFSVWAATKYSQRFKAAVVFAGITNWHSFMGTTDIPYEEALVHWDLWCYDEQALCWDRSPMAHINNARTPTLIAHGERDLRVPLSQGWELYTALKIKGVPTEFVIYPREPHGLRERAHQLDYINRALNWFDRYVKGEVGTN